MLSPDFLRDITDRVEAAADRLNQYLINRIVRRIVRLYEKKNTVELIPSSVRDVQKMQEAGKAYEEINTEVQNRLPDLRKEVNRAFQQSVAEAARDNEKFTESLADSLKVDAEIPKTPNKIANINDIQVTNQEKQLIESAFRRTNGTIQNLTRTTASAWQKKYIEILDDAYNKVAHGVSINTAISEAIDDAAKYGSRVEYPSGRSDKIEVAIARAVRTGVNQAAADMTLAKCAQLGVNHVLVSSHLGARYTDRIEPANHMSWQGKVYSINWRSSLFSKYNPDLSEKISWAEKIKNAVRRALTSKKNKSQGDFETVTGYGTGEGLCGWNCRHSFSPFFEGVNINNTEQYDSKKNKARYDNEQKQRAMERRLREIKKAMNAKKAGMEAATTGALKELLRNEYNGIKNSYNRGIREYNQFCDKNGLKPLYERLKVPEM